MASSRWVTKGTRLLLLAVLAMLSALGLVSSRSDRTAAQDPTPRPNIVLIVTDDQRRDTLRYMPSVQRNLRGAGVTFSIATAETPLCCPSRASILTGKYTDNHGIWFNGLPDGGLPSSGTTAATNRRSPPGCGRRDTRPATWGST